MKIEEAYRRDSQTPEAVGGGTVELRTAKCLFSWDKMALIRNILCIRWLTQVFLSWESGLAFKCF